MPWGRFNGIEPAVVHEHYDAHGTLTGRTVVLREAEWSQSDRDHAVALLEYEAGLCGGCGHPLVETTDPLMEGRYKPDGAVECFMCRATSIGSKEYEDVDHPSAWHLDVVALPKRKYPLGGEPRP